MLKYQNRSNARFVFVQLLFENNISNKNSFSLDNLDAFDDIEINDIDKVYFTILVEQWLKIKSYIPEIVDKYSPKRSYIDINPAEKAILSLGIIEKSIGQLEDKIILDECIEISKVLDIDFKFANAILDNIFKHQNFHDTFNKL